MLLHALGLVAGLLAAQVGDVGRIELVPRGMITVADLSLSDWAEIRPLLKATCQEQWQDVICGRRPTRCGVEQGDLEASLYLAWDGSTLFFGAKVRDDVVMAVPKADRRPYRGDAAELFVIVDCDSEGDYHECAAKNRTVFQLIISPTELTDRRYHFADYRTPAGIIERALRSGFETKGWRTADGWEAEAGLPLASLGEAGKAIAGGTPVRLAVDVLDYDSRLAEWQDPCWGFEPDHVVSSANRRELVTPKGMREFVFQLRK